MRSISRLAPLEYRTDVRRRGQRIMYEEHDYGRMDGRHIPSTDDGKMAFETKMEFRGFRGFFECFCSAIMNKLYIRQTSNISTYHSCRVDPGPGDT